MSPELALAGGRWAPRCASTSCSAAPISAAASGTCWPRGPRAARAARADRAGDRPDLGGEPRLADPGRRAAVHRLPAGVRGDLGRAARAADPVPARRRAARLGVRVPRLDTTGDAASARLGPVFSIASTIAPVLLGMIVGALVSGRSASQARHRARRLLRARGWRRSRSRSACFALALCAFLAATYLTVEGRDPALREDFRAARAGRGRRGRLRRARGVRCSAGRRAARARGAGRRGPGAGRSMRSRARPRSRRLAALATPALSTGARGRRRADGAHPARLGAGAVSRTSIVPDMTLADAARRPRTLRLLLIALAAGVPCWCPASCCCSACSSGQAAAPPDHPASRAAASCRVLGVLAVGRSQRSDRLRLARDGWWNEPRRRPRRLECVRALLGTPPGGQVVTEHGGADHTWPMATKPTSPSKPFGPPPPGGGSLNTGMSNSAPPAM